MLAVNVSNPNLPYFNQIIAHTAIGVSIDALESLGASQMLASRVWTVLGETCSSSISDLTSGSVYGNFGDVPAVRDSLQKATRLGEASLGAVDFGLIAYVRPL